jgi:nucleoid DNA-binding protein
LPGERFATALSTERIFRLNKTEHIATIAEDADLSRADATPALDGTLEQLTRALVGRESVGPIGLGSFSVSRRVERTARNPLTSEQLTVQAPKVPIFAAGKALRGAGKAP